MENYTKLRKRMKGTGVNLNNSILDLPHVDSVNKGRLDKIENKIKPALNQSNLYLISVGLSKVSELSILKDIFNYASHFSGACSNWGVKGGVIITRPIYNPDEKKGTIWHPNFHILIEINDKNAEKLFAKNIPLAPIHISPNENREFICRLRRDSKLIKHVTKHFEKNDIRIVKCDLNIFNYVFSNPLRPFVSRVNDSILNADPDDIKQLLETIKGRSLVRFFGSFHENSKQKNNQH